MKETLDQESRDALISYRLERAYKSLEEALYLSEGGYYNAAVNRLYYACYYAAVALLLKNDISAQTHSGVKTMLGLHFVSKGKLPTSIHLPLCLRKDIVEIMMISYIVTRRWLMLSILKQRLLLSKSMS